MYGLNSIDYGIIGIIFFSVIVGLLRGFVRDSMSLMTWIVAGILAVSYCDEVAARFTSISIVGVRLLLAVILIVLVTLVVGGIVSHLVSKLVQSTKFSITDRIIGILFGFARGVVITAFGILMTTLIVKPSNLSKNENWKASVLIPQFEPAVHWMKVQLPENILKFIEDPAKNPDEIKKKIEKPLAKPLGELETDIGALQKTLENVEVEENSVIEELTDNGLAD